MAGQRLRPREELPGLPHDVHRGARAAASVLGEPRERFARHGFQGANFFMLAMLERYRDELGVVALPQELSLSRQRTLELLRTERRDACRSRAPSSASGRLEAEVVVTNTAGHKVPTAYPSRRAWLRFVVSDDEGRRLFSSGALRPDGSIEGNDNDGDPLAFEPHHREHRGARPGADLRIDHGWTRAGA